MSRGNERLNNAIRGGCSNFQAHCNAVHGLMMPAVGADAISFHNSGQLTPGLHNTPVQDPPPIRISMYVCFTDIRDMCIQCSPQRYIEYLHAATDAQYRDILSLHSSPNQFDLCDISLSINGLNRFVVHLSLVMNWRHIGTARHNEAI